MTLKEEKLKNSGLYEIQAEVTLQGITKDDIYTANKKNIPANKWDEFTQTENYKTLKKIYSVLKQNNLLKDMKTDSIKDMDITPRADGNWNIKTETGKSFVYNSKANKLQKV
jgi:hypothetical protein